MAGWFFSLCERESVDALWSKLAGLALSLSKLLDDEVNLSMFLCPTCNFPFVRLLLLIIVEFHHFSVLTLGHPSEHASKSSIDNGYYTVRGLPLSVHSCINAEQRTNEETANRENRQLSTRTVGREATCG